MSNTEIPAGQPPAASPWHAGELAMQRSAGAEAKMDKVGRKVVRTFLLDQHRAFYPLLSYVALGTVDPEGRAWATLRAGRPGFLQAPTPLRLDVAAVRDLADPADRGMDDGMAIGLLGIDMATRRRNRLNGTIQRSGDQGFGIAVQHSFGNCPRYIQYRDVEFLRNPAMPSPLPVEPALSGNSLDARARQLIAQADSLFVTTYVDQDGARQVDVSHRGGQAGFVRVDADGTLTVPDFNGNLFFNTLGNMLQNPKTGLLFVDHASGDLLQLTGTAEVVLNAPEIAAFQGAERLWRFRATEGTYRPQALPLRWAFRAEGWSPSALMTGNWQEAEASLVAAALGRGWRPFRVQRVVEESASVRSLYLEPADGAGLLPYRAGQHLPIRLRLAGASAWTARTYTLSQAPSEGGYRISVKRDGAVSSHLHGLQPGDLMDASAPAGGFTMDAAQPRPAVLLAGGIGITPLLAMLGHLVFEAGRTQRKRPVVLLQAARNKAEQAFTAEIAALVARSNGALRWLRVLGNTEGAVAGQDYDHAGRIDIPLLQSSLPFGDYDFYLCGPPGFTQALYDGLSDMNVADDRIHAEAFGPASLQRRAAPAAPTSPLRQDVAVSEVAVSFVRSNVQANWRPDAGTLLELAEQAGLAPAHGCRAGHCGSCSTRILEGEVAYPTLPAAAVAPGEALVCCAVPAASAAGSVQPLRLDL